MSKFFVSFDNERQIENYLASYMTENGSCPISGDPVDMLFRQHKFGPYGVADLVSIAFIPAGLCVNIIEIKNESLKASHVAQLSRYMAAARHYVEMITPSLVGANVVSVKGILAGPFDGGDLAFLLRHLKWISVYDIKVSVDTGIEISEVSDDWIKPSARKKDQIEVFRDIQAEYDANSHIINGGW